jgi:hypothetical protein
VKRHYLEFTNECEIYILYRCAMLAAFTGLVSLYVVDSCGTCYDRITRLPTRGLAAVSVPLEKTCGVAAKWGAAETSKLTQCNIAITSCSLDTHLTKPRGGSV